MGIKERIAKAFNAYYKERHVRPTRITVSPEVAAELDAKIAADDEALCKRLAVREPILLCELGHIVFFRGVPVVCDLEPDKILDVR